MGKSSKLLFGALLGVTATVLLSDVRRKKAEKQLRKALKAGKDILSEAEKRGARKQKK